MMMPYNDTGRDADNRTTMTKSQVFFWSLVAFIGGVALASFLPLPPILLGAFFILGATVLFMAALNLPERRRLALAGLLALAVALGAWRFLASAGIERGLDPVLGTRVTLAGVIGSEPLAGSGSQRFTFREERTGSNILVITRPYPEFRYGDRLELTGRPERPENFSPDFDYVAYLAKDDIFYTASFPEIKVLSHNQGSRLAQELFALKAAFAERLNRHLPEPEAAFMAGLILGERRAIPKELNDQFQITGTSHIVALSGFNITIVSKAFLRTLVFLAIPFSWAFWVAVLGILFFTILVGAQASVVRAAIMGILVLIAEREDRLYRMRNALVFAAFVMIFYNPKILRFDAAFQLSFLATIGLLYTAPIFDRWFERVKTRTFLFFRDAAVLRENREVSRIQKGPSLFREIAVATLAAQFMVLPLLVFRFGRLSLVSPLANLAVLPFIPATMFFGFVTGLFGFVSALIAEVSGWVSWLFLHYELSAIRFFSEVPAAALGVGSFPGWLVAALYLLIGVWMWRRHKQNPNLRIDSNTTETVTTHSHTIR